MWNEDGEASETGVRQENESHRGIRDMKRFIKIILSLLLLAVLGLVGLYAYLGGFESIVIAEKQAGPFRLVYREMRGTDMQQVGTITDEIAKTLTKAGFRTHQPFDVFFPDAVPSQIGFVIAAEEEVKLAALDPSIKQRTIPAQKCMVTTFPWKRPASFIVGYMKVDPALKAYRDKHNYANGWAATLHDGDIITYIQPVISQ